MERVCDIPGHASFVKIFLISAIAWGVVCMRRNGRAGGCTGCATGCRSL